jgi:hypothetical protein
MSSIASIPFYKQHRQTTGSALPKNPNHQLMALNPNRANRVLHLGKTSNCCSLPALAVVLLLQPPLFTVIHERCLATPAAACSTYLATAVD